MNIFWVLLVFFVIGAMQAALFGRKQLKRLTYRREFSKTSLYEGEAIEMIETLENRSLLPIPWLRIETHIPPELRFGSQENLTIVEGRYHRSFFFMGPFSRVVRRHRVTCVGRGYFNLSSASLTYGDLFGFSSRSRTLDLDLFLTVWPHIMPTGDFVPPSTRMLGDVLVRRWIMPDLFLIGGIRPWRDGDSLRDIHWRATARTGSVQVKQHDYTASPKLLVLLNTQVEEHQWGEIAVHDRPKVEEAIAYCASLMMAAMEAGVEVGFGTNGELVMQRDETVLLPPMLSESARTMLLDTLARLSMRRGRNFHSYLENIPLVGGYDVLILTPYTSMKIENQAAALRLRGNTVTMRSWEGGVPRADDIPA